MPATLILEDGSGVPDSNSYIDLDFARQFAENRGVELDADDTVVISMVITAADYIESFEDQFKGHRVDESQSLSWPRDRVFIRTLRLPSDEIPVQLKNAQAAGVLEIANGNELNPSITSYAVRREKVDVIEVEYAAGSSVNSSATPQITPKYPRILQWLRPLLKNSAGMLKVERA